MSCASCGGLGSESWSSTVSVAPCRVGWRIACVRLSPLAAGREAGAQSCPAATVEPACLGALLVKGCAILRHGDAPVCSRSGLSERATRRGQRRRAGQSDDYRIACRYRFHGRTSCSSVLRGRAAGPRAGRPGAARCELPTPSRLPDLTLPAISPVPIAQGVALVRAVVALSRLTHIAAIAGSCRGGLGGRNEGGQSQRGDEQLHGFVPSRDGPPSVGLCSSA